MEYKSGARVWYVRVEGSCMRNDLRMDIELNCADSGEWLWGDGLTVYVATARA